MLPLLWKSFHISSKYDEYIKNPFSNCNIKVLAIKEDAYHLFNYCWEIVNISLAYRIEFETETELSHIELTRK